MFAPFGWSPEFWIRPGRLKHTPTTWQISPVQAVRHTKMVDVVMKSLAIINGRRLALHAASRQSSWAGPATQ